MIPPPALAQPAPEPAAALASLIAAELAFAADATRRDTWTAFLAVLHPEALIFAPEAVNGPEYARRQGRDPGRLSWFPAFAELSSDGRWGYTSGPWEYRSDPKTSRPDRRGRFASLWHREPDGIWKLMADGRCPDAPDDATLQPLRPGDPPRPAQPLGLERSEAELRGLDRPRLPEDRDLALVHGTEGGRSWYRIWIRIEGTWRLRVAARLP